MGQLGILVRIPPLPPFFLIQLFQRKYLCYNLATVLLSLHICSTSWQETPSYMFFFTFSLQTSKVLGTSWTDLPKRPPQIFELIKIESKYLDISNCVFTMNCSTDKKIVFWSFLGRDFICMWEKFQRCQSSNSSFLQKYPIFWTTNVQILFF